MVGVWGLQSLNTDRGQAETFNVCGMIAILGLYLTIYFTPETMGKHLVEERPESKPNKPGYEEIVAENGGVEVAGDDDDYNEVIIQSN